MTDKKITEYKGFEIRPHRKSYRIYHNDIFKQASSSLKKAKKLIDFCIEGKLWQ